MLITLYLSQQCFPKSRIFASSEPGKICLDEGNTAFYRVIRSKIFRVLMTLFVKITSLSYNNISYRPFTQSIPKTLT
jgi:hypothetical protein